MESSNPLETKMELTSEFSSISAPIVVPPLPENIKAAFSRTNSVDSNVSNSQINDDLFAKQRNSTRSTKSALSILFAAENEKLRGTPSTKVPGVVLDHERLDWESKEGATGSNLGSSIDTSNLSRSPSLPSDASLALDKYGNSLRRSGSGSQCVSRSKSISRSNSISQSSMHSLSDSSINNERGIRVQSTSSMDRKSPFCGLAASNQETDQSLSVSHDHHDHHNHHDHHDYHHHTHASESARRILASASFDSDLSDGGLGAEFAGSDAEMHDFSASDEEEDVQEFDEFADFNEFDHLGGEMNRSNSSAGFSNIDRVFSASADSWDRAPTTDKLTVKHLITTILSNELLFQPKSPGAKHKESLAAKFLKTSRDSIIGSFTGAKHSILHAHLGLHNESNGTMNSENSDASALSTLQQNLLNAAASLPKNLQKKSSAGRAVTGPGAGGGSPQQRQQQQEQREVEALLKSRLCVYPAEDDGTPMDDLPEFSGTNDILQSGIDDLALMDKVLKVTLLHLNITGRLEDNSMMLDGLDDSAYYDQQYETYAVLSPTERAVLNVESADEASGVGAGRASRTRKSDLNGTERVSFSLAEQDDLFQKSRHRPTVGTTMEVLTYDTQDLALNPVDSLGYEDRYYSSDGSSSSGSDPRDHFARERSSSNNDIIQMFRTETDEMLQNKIEAALEEERLENERKSKSECNSDDSQLDAQHALKDRDHSHDRGRSAKRKSSSASDEKNTTYITISGRRNADDEWKIVMKIPVRHGRPVVTLPTVLSSSSSPKRAEKDKFVPNSRDIAITTPSKAGDSTKKTAKTPSPMPLPARRSQYSGFDLDSATSAAVQAHQQPDLRERKSDTDAGAFPSNFAPNPTTTPGHQRNRTFDFANFSGKFDNNNLNSNNSPLPGGADEEDVGFERRFSNTSAASRSKSVDVDQGAYLLNPHTSSSAINYFAISTNTTPTNTTRKTLSASANHSNNSSASNLKAALLGGGGGVPSGSSLSPKNMHAEGQGFDTGPYPVISHPISHTHSDSNSVHDAHDTIQIARRSRSNSILSQYLEQQDPSGTGTNRSSISSELSDGSCFSQLHQQLLAAQPSRNSSRSGSINFINSANLAGGGFSSDDCSDGGSSSSGGSDIEAAESDSHSHRHSARSAGHPHPHGDGGHASHHHHHSHKSARKSGSGRNLPPINVSLDAGDSNPSGRTGSHHSSYSNSHNSSGSRSPVKEHSPTNKANASPPPGSITPQGSTGNSPLPDVDTSADTEGASTTGKGEKSSFYFLSRLFGTFRRSTATAITPRASAANIGIIHEAEFEDSDSSGSNHSSVKDAGVNEEA